MKLLFLRLLTNKYNSENEWLQNNPQQYIKTAVWVAMILGVVSTLTGCLIVLECLGIIKTY